MQHGSEDRAGGPGGARPARVTGLAHLGAAAGYSVAGAARLWHEAAFRHEVLAFALLLPVYVAAGARPAEIVGFLVLSCLLIAVEALNTAIEEIIDRVSPEWSDTGLHAKNLGSLAVMAVLVAHGILLAYVLIV